jgi:hypothetical protein
MGSRGWLWIIASVGGILGIAWYYGDAFTYRPPLSDAQVNERMPKSRPTGFGNA